MAPDLFQDSVKATLLSLIIFFCQTAGAAVDSVNIKATIDRGQDLGQSFGSLFEVTSNNGQLVIGAGFQNAYNTRYRADRHALQFFVRPKNGKRKFTIKELPRPNNTHTGAYLFGRDGEIYSTEGGLSLIHI